MKILLLLFTFLLTNKVFAQVNFQQISFDDALTKARKEGKFIFLQYESSTCQQCNEVANKSFQSDNLGKRVEESFIPIKISSEHRDRQKVESLYNIPGFGTLFIDPSGILIHRYNETSSMDFSYSKEIDIAIYEAGEISNLTQYENEYKKGNKSFGLIEQILIKRNALNLPTESLLDEYLNTIPADSLNTVKTLQIIARMAPILETKADRVLRKDAALFRKAWYNLSSNERIKINGKIISKSMKQAVERKDENFAKRLASFVRSTYDNNPVLGVKAHDNQLMRFYLAINDTAKYLQNALVYYDRYFMQLNADSVKKLDHPENRPFSASDKKRDTIINGKNAFIQTRSIVPRGQYLTQELNSGAWNLYKMTSDPDKLKTALGWIEKGLQFFESPEALDTYARLLYKQGQKKKAIEIQEKAISFKGKRGFQTDDYETVLQKMKNNATVID